MTPATFANRRARIERAADRLIFGFPIGVGEAWQLQKRYRRHRSKLFVFLHRDDVEPTNNSSERDLRPSKTQQKISGRLASDDVTQDRLDIRGYIDTARKHGHNAMDVLHQLMAGTPWRPPAAAFSP